MKFNRRCEILLFLNSKYWLNYFDETKCSNVNRRDVSKVHLLERPTKFSDRWQDIQHMCVKEYNSNLTRTDADAYIYWRTFRCRTYPASRPWKAYKTRDTMDDGSKADTLPQLHNEILEIILNPCYRVILNPCYRYTLSNILCGELTKHTTAERRLLFLDVFLLEY